MTALDRRYDTQIHRRTTRTVMVGDVAIGSDHPVVVQSMINEDTLDIDAAVAGIVRLSEACRENVRVTTTSMAQPAPWGRSVLPSEPRLLGAVGGRRPPQRRQDRDGGDAVR